MTGVKLKDIKGVLVEKSEVCFCGSLCDCVDNAIDTQGRIPITLNRERLARVIFEKLYGALRWDMTSNQWYVSKYYELADAIIKSQKDLLERGE